MTVSSQTPINRSTGNGVTTVFPYGFKIISEADIEVTVDGVAKTLNVDYTVSGVGNEAGGNVTMTAAPANLASVVRRRNMALVRTTDYQDQGEMPAATLDNDFDSAVLMIQQVDEQIGRAVTVPAGVSGFDGQLPDPVSSMFLRINSAADGFDLVSEVTPGALTVTPFIETLLNDTDAAAARATLGAQVAGSYQAAGSYQPANSGSGITTLPDLAAGGLPNNCVLTADIADAQVTPAKLSQPFTLGAVTNTTSGTSIDFTGLPSWAKRVTVSFNGVSTNGSSNLLMRLGAGSVDTTGYSATACTNAGIGGSATDSFSTGFSLVHATGGAAASTISGSVVFTLINAASNTWAGSGVLNSYSGGAVYTIAGVKALAGALDRIRLTASNGTDTFDSGSVNITWE